jgi:hypothetical protein
MWHALPVPFPASPYAVEAESSALLDAPIRHMLTGPDFRK